MGKNKVLVKISPEGKFVVNVDKSIKIEDCVPNTRVALKSDSYLLHKILPSKVNLKYKYEKIYSKSFLVSNYFR
jgi:26S proteasome regulatory subunit T6